MNNPGVFFISKWSMKTIFVAATNLFLLKKRCRTGMSPPMIIKRQLKDFRNNTDSITNCVLFHWNHIHTYHFGKIQIFQTIGKRVKIQTSKIGWNWRRWRFSTNNTPKFPWNCARDLQCLWWSPNDTTASFLDDVKSPVFHGTSSDASSFLFLWHVMEFLYYPFQLIA